MNHFYLHIPFCRQKCPYCKFALTPIFDEAKKKRYIAYLKKEIGEYFLSSRRDPFQNQVGENNTQNLISEGKSDSSASLRNDKTELSTIYFGGGTPSVLSLDEVREILNCFPFFRESENQSIQHLHNEVSFECNPEDITREYIEGLFTLGVNRLSIGVQSLNNETLKAIHRSEREVIFRALESVQSALLSFHDTENNGVDAQTTTPAHQQISINIDLILGLPFSKPGETLANIQKLHEHFPYITHTSVYMLEDELYPKDWEQNSLTEEQIRQEFVAIIEYFVGKNWHHYELSNFSKPGYECAHNRAYWDHSEYHGFGLSASSLGRLEKDEAKGDCDWIRSQNSCSFSGYYSGKREEESLTKEDIEIEKIMFGLRTDGCDIGNPQIDAQKLKNLLEDKLLMIQGGKILPTKTGIFLIDYIIGRLIAEN